MSDFQKLFLNGVQFADGQPRRWQNWLSLILRRTDKHIAAQNVEIIGAGAHRV
jgi:hypothetical protein